jgi:hypothetical protein
MRALAERRGGECLSDKYVNNEMKLRWRCAAGHEWEAAPGLVKGGTWCPHCAHVARLSLNAMASIAASQGGRCLSTEYINVATHLSWRCEAGHQWTATAASIRSGKWCPRCVHNQHLELEAMQRLALRRGGRCLSTMYVNNRQPLLWECKRRHRWKATSHTCLTSTMGPCSKESSLFGLPISLEQLDFHFGVGLSSAAVHHFHRDWLSFRFQAIRRK